MLAAAPLAAQGEVELDGETAHHLRVRRLEAGEVLRVTDGAGRLGRGTLVSLRKGGATVALEETWAVAAPAALHLLAPVADRERMLWLAEKAVELGATSWRAVRWRRSRSVSPRGEGAAFQAKVRARLAVALLQCGRAWLPAVHDDVEVDALAAEPSGDVRRLLLDADGASVLAMLTPADVAGPIAVAVGPEGGVEPDERAALVAAGFAPAALGDAVLRFETAGAAALAVVAAARLTPAPRAG